jgi:hypothetical protein
MQWVVRVDLQQRVHAEGGTVSVENYNATTHGLNNDGPWTRVEQGQRINFGHPQADYHRVWTMLDLIRVLSGFLGMRPPC